MINGFSSGSHAAFRGLAGIICTTGTIENVVFGGKKRYPRAGNAVCFDIARRHTTLAFRDRRDSGPGAFFRANPVASLATVGKYRK
jgi:hypothetical protein